MRGSIDKSGRIDLCVSWTGLTSGAQVSRRHAYAMQEQVVCKGVGGCSVDWAALRK